MATSPRSATGAVTGNPLLAVVVLCFGGLCAALTQTLVIPIQSELPTLLGPAPFDDESASLEDKVGVCNGLAYTAAGGELLEVEVSVVAGRGRVQLTGTLGDVVGRGDADPVVDDLPGGVFDDQLAAQNRRVEITFRSEDTAS